MRWILALSLVLFLALVTTSSSSSNSQSNKKVIRLTEKTLRERATKSVMPSFPEDAMKRGAKGLAVAELEFDTKGDVTLVEIVETPDPSISEALGAAIKQWKFRTFKMAGEPVCVRGVLSFRYQSDGTKGTVRNAQ